MATKPQLELHNKQLTETNKRLGDDVVRLEAELSKARGLRIKTLNDINIQNKVHAEYYNNLHSRFKKMKKKYNIARKFIQSINDL